MPVTSFLHYALEVPDQTVGQRDDRDFGLVEATGGTDVVRLRPSGSLIPPHRQDDFRAHVRAPLECLDREAPLIPSVRGRG